MSTTQSSSTAAPITAAPVANGQRTIDAKAAIAILNKRTTLTPNHVGQLIRTFMQGNGVFMAKGTQYEANGVTNTSDFDRMIYNLRANSALIMATPEAKALFSEALKAESAGEASKAHDLFNEYLNLIQLSFSVILPSSRTFSSGQLVDVVVGSVINKAGKHVLIAEQVTPVTAAVVAKTTFSVDDLMESI